jgi:hypothetical protein
MTFFSLSASELSAKREAGIRWSQEIVKDKATDEFDVHNR